MKKTLNLILAVLVAAVGFSFIEARLTGTDPGTDTFCVGPSGAEACVDANGGVIPTTSADADLGTSALLWNALHLTAGGITDGAVTTADLGADSVIEAKILNGSISTGKLEDNAVATAKLWLDLPTSAAACVTTKKLLGTCSNGPGTTGLCNCS